MDAFPGQETPYVCCDVDPEAAMLLPTVVYWENGTAVILPELLLDGGICTWGFWKDHPFRNFKDENGWVHKKCEKSLEFPRAIIGFRRQAVNFRSQQVFCKAPLRTEAVWTFLLKTHQPTLCQVPWLCDGYLGHFDIDLCFAWGFSAESRCMESGWSWWRYT